MNFQHSGLKLTTLGCDPNRSTLHSHKEIVSVLQNSPYYNIPIIMNYVHLEHSRHLILSVSVEKLLLCFVKNKLCYCVRLNLSLSLCLILFTGPLSDCFFFFSNNSCYFIYRISFLPERNSYSFCFFLFANHLIGFL